VSFQTPISISEAILKMDQNKYLLPAIQREFVWSHDKVEWLFDSIMRNYPISSFLFWEVNEQTAKGYKFYKFIPEYRERYKTHNDEISTNGLASFNAVLDGQQRLTSLYLGLKGSFAYKEYRKKWENNEISIPTRQLYLNIDKELDNEEDGRVYEFKFLKNQDTNNKTIYISNTGVSWFKVGEILNLTNDEDLDDFVENLNGSFARKAIRQLKRTINDYKLINFFLEKDQNIDKALNIFIRINSGGEPLSFSDLIMSIAVANWEKKDARKEIHQLVDNIRDKGFNISKDLILKTFLYLYSTDIKFKVNNFSKDNAQLFEKKWDNIRNAILETFDLIKTFGFNDFTLTSKNSVLPIIYWIYHNKIYKDFSTKTEYKTQRLEIKKWLHISLLKQLFSGTSDSVLSQMRKAFSPEKLITSSYPTQEIFSFVKKDISIGDEFIEDLLNVQYEESQSFSILALLFPHLDYKNNSFHKDHLHPQDQFKNLSSLDKTKYSWREYNSIINLQILDSNENMSKNKSPLNEWIEKETINNVSYKEQFLKNHLLPLECNFEITEFDHFFTERKKILFDELYKILK
jgi:uncharacterized protein with ParB-like and HNH nuclease domain